MPWKQTNIVKTREEFVLRALDPNSNVTDLCKEYQISRKTAYKWIQRFKERGVEGLRDMSRRPRSSPLQASGESVLRVLELRTQHPRWGPKKLHAVLQRSNGGNPATVPSRRTIARILQRMKLTTPRHSRPTTAAPQGAPAPPINQPNDLWTVDFKGWWRARDGVRCEPLTVRDAFSRDVLYAQLMKSRAAEVAREHFEGLFQVHGLPIAILMDNGTPFIATRARGGLTTLSAWWISLGIKLYRSRLAHPQDNGGHERMHLDILRDVQQNPAPTFEQQQKAIDLWRHEFNHHRPHEALEMRVPADLYRASTRHYQGPRPVFYPPGFIVRKVQKSGIIKLQGRSLRVGQALAGYHVGLEPRTENTFQLFFYDMDLGSLELSP